MQTEKQIIASRDVVVEDTAIGINRKIFAGTPVPADLVGAYRKAVGETPDDEPADPGEQNLESLSMEELEAKVEAAGIEVEGTGNGGRVLKADLVAALEAHGA